MNRPGSVFPAAAVRGRVGARALALFAACLALLFVGRASAVPLPEGCLISGSNQVVDVRPGDLVKSFNSSSTGNPDLIPRIRVIARPPFLPPGGHLVGPPGGSINFNYCESVRPGFRPGVYWLKIEHSFVDRLTGKVDFCVVFLTRIRLLPSPCAAAPTCSVIEAGPLQATVGGEFPEFTVCVETGCDDAHGALDLSCLPGFLGLVGQSRDAEGRCCYTFRIYACSTDVGLHTVTFKATNGDGGKPVGECSVDVEILDAE